MWSWPPSAPPRQRFDPTEYVRQKREAQFQQAQRAARRAEPASDPAALTLRVREMLKHPGSYARDWSAVHGFDMAAALAGLPDLPVLLTAGPGALYADCLGAAAAALPRARVAGPEAGGIDAHAARIAAFLDA